MMTQGHKTFQVMNCLKVDLTRTCFGQN